MFCFMSAKEAAKKWDISQRRVSILCSENRICGAMMLGNMWIIPSNASKPVDKRTIRYVKSKTITLKPFIKWVGGKGQLVSELVKLIPSDGKKVLKKYVEPFVGGGALLFYLLTKYDFSEVHVSDVNAELINSYKVVKNNVDGLIAMLTKMQNDYLPLSNDLRKNYYYSVRENYNNLLLTEDTATLKAAQFIFLNKTCFNGLYRVNRKGQFNVPMGAYKNPTICDENNFHNVSEALRNVTIDCCDYSRSCEFIDDMTLVYLDPPFRPISKTAKFTAYTADCFDDNEQRRLANFFDEINDKGAIIILSNSDPKNINPADNFFEQLYAKYKILKVEATRMINSISDKRGKINELLIYN